MEESNKTIDKLVNDPSFKRWAEGSASHVEIDFWDRWVEKSEYNKKLAIAAQQQLLGFRVTQKSSDALKVWSRIEQQIEHEQPTMRKGRTVTLKPAIHIRERGRMHGSAFAQLMKVAAIILIMLTGGLIWFTTSYVDETEIYTEQTNLFQTSYGEQKEIILPDGTEIVLNANSVIQYKASLEDERNIEIELDGEAYFSVTSVSTANLLTENSSGNFRVITRDGTVEVLGTKFSVSSRNDKTTVVLETGEVYVLPHLFQKNNEKGFVMSPDELAQFSTSNSEVARYQVNSLVYTSWKDSRLILDSTPVEEIFERLEFTFGVEFKVVDSSVLTRKLSGSIENADLHTMITILGEVLDLPVEVTNEYVYVGTF